MNQPPPHNPPRRKRIPILARHAVSLAVVFAVALPVSYFVGQRVYQNIQLGKLQQTDEAKFDEGLAYVYEHTPKSPRVVKRVVELSDELPPERAIELVLTAATAAALEEDAAEARDQLADAAAALFERLDPMPAIGFYDAMTKLEAEPSPRMGNALLAHLDEPDDATFMQIVDLLEPRLLWSKDRMPRALWLRWLGILADGSAEVSQIKAAQLLGDQPDAVDNPQVKRTLALLAKSPHDTVRAHALQSAAGYAALARDPTDYEQIIFALGEDENKVIARRAWMIVGHLDPLSGYAVKWKEADPFVAEAMLWAAVKTNPENPQPAIEAWQAGQEIIAAFALYESTPKYLVWRTHTGKLLYESLTTPPANEAGVLRFWRSLPVLHDDWESLVYGEIRGELFPTLFKHLKPADIRKSRYRHIIESVVYYGRVGFEPTLWQEADNGLLAAWIEGLQRGPLEMAQTESLTYYEQIGELLSPFEIVHLDIDDGVLDRNNIDRFSYRTDSHWDRYSSILAAAGSDHPIYADTRLLTDYTPDEATLRFWVAINAEQARNRQQLSSPVKPQQPPHLNAIQDLLADNRSSYYLAGALYAAMVDDHPTIITGVSADLIRRYPDLSDEAIRAMTESELAELGLKRVDALPALLEAAEAAPPSANRSTEAKLLRLALWMRGDLGDDFTPKAEAMLFDKQLPTSTVLMCLLHMKRPIALAYLFGDRVTPRPNLHELFIQERWWHVFRRFVDTSDLTLWLWGDPEAQAFQIEAMRQWYAVNRWKIERGWWPEPVTSP